MPLQRARRTYSVGLTSNMTLRFRKGRLSSLEDGASCVRVTSLQQTLTRWVRRARSASEVSRRRLLFTPSQPDVAWSGCG